MHKSTVLLLFYIGIFIVLFNNKIVAQDTVRLLSWNIQMLPNGAAAFSKSLRKKQAVRIKWVIDYAKNNNFDAIVFQEVFDVQMKNKLKKGLKKAYPYHIKTRTKFGKMTSNGVYMVSRQPLKYIAHCVYNQVVTEDKLAAKGCTLAEWQIGKTTILLGGTHLQSGGRESIQTIRNSQYIQIKLLFDKHKNENNAQILAGDLNTEKALLPRYELMLKTLNMNDITISDNRPFTSDSINTWNKSEKNPSQIDYILIQNFNSKVKIHKQTIIRPRNFYKGEEMDLADHYGVLAEIIIAE